MCYNGTVEKYPKGHCREICSGFFDNIYKKVMFIVEISKTLQ